LKTKILILMIVGICARLFLAYFFYGNYDQESYQIVVDIVKSGGNVYSETQRYNYSPIWSLILTSLSYIPFPFHFAVRSFLTVIDIIIALMIITITEKPYLGALFMVNPVSILITGFHGQFENLAVLPLLFAVYASQKKKGSWLIFLLGLISILIKHITIFGVVALYFYTFKDKRKAIIALMVTTIIFLISFLPYLPEGRENIINQVFFYSSSTQPYSLFYLIPFWSTPTFAIGMVLFLIIYRNSSINEQILKSFLAFLILTPGIGEQYFVLPIIFGSIFPKFGYYLFSIITSIFLLGSKGNLHLPIPSIWISVWIVSIIWLINSSKNFAKI